MTTKILTIRLPAPFYSDLCKQAAELGLSISSHVRHVLQEAHDANALNRLREDVLARLNDIGASRSQAPHTQSEIVEILLLCRALAADRNPQIVAQVKVRLQQLTQQ